MSEELKKLEELLANDRKIIEDNYKEIERLNKCYCERTDCSGRIKNSKKYESVQEENERLHSIIKEVREYCLEKAKGRLERTLYDDILEILEEENI